MDPVKLPDDVSTAELIYNPRIASDLPLQEAADLLPAVETMRGQLDLLARLLRARLAGAALEGAADESTPPEPSEPGDNEQAGELGWRVKLWEVPAETRLGSKDVAEAVGRNVNWVHQRTQKGADPMLPHAKLGNTLVFKAGEVRTFLREHEQVICAAPMDSTEAEKRDLRAVE